MQNTTVFEVFNLNVSVKSDFCFESFTSVSGDFNNFVDLEISFTDINVESLFSS